MRVALRLSGGGAERANPAQGVAAGEFVEYVKNPSYFVPGRPYLDGLRYVVIA